MDTDLSNKNIILISPQFFDYEKEIKNELERRGAFVYYIDDRIKNNTFNKILFRLNLKKKVGKNSVTEYFEHQLDNVQNKKIHFLIAISPEGFSAEIIKYYKQHLKDTIFILYMWDSIKNRPYIVEDMVYFNRKLTFDKGDSDKYGFEFRPLFYTNDYKKIGMKSVKPKYDLAFIGTAHSDRYQVIKNLIKGVESKLNTFLFFYLQSPLLIAYYWVIHPEFRKIKFKDISFKSLSNENVLSVIEKSNCVIDINHRNQDGLTMRTIEVLGAKRKLITTNSDIVTYDFYNANNILLVDRNNPIFDPLFLIKPYKEIDVNIYNKYSLNQWVNDIL